MNKILWTILLLFPAVLFAEQSAMNFNPPPGDLSVIFLSNIFGVVEGVLHGTGSQILGNMFAVFNSAVMGLGSIMIMYTLIVGTMNTAHEGQFLGQKWASIWVPMRSVLGISLLVPQSSGYCMMQIFVMWVVVQGVGAADKVWGVALNYLNRGGVIVQAQMDPTTSMTADNTAIAKGAAVILQGQVCMLAVQKMIKSAQTDMVSNARQFKSGPCYEPTGMMKEFCTGTIPDFIASVNAVTQQQNTAPTDQGYSLPMPNFKGQGIYDALSGMCGTIKWKDFAQNNAAFKKLTTYSVEQASRLTNQDIAQQKINTIMGSQPPPNLAIGDSDLQTAKLSRAIAIQQMYVGLSMIAQVIIGNNPVFSPRESSGMSPAIPGVAYDQFGVPQDNRGNICPANNDKCIGWGPDYFSKTAPVFNGSEFQGAITDYNAIMRPTLALLAQAARKSDQSEARAFIFQAQQEGWMMAGSYFFYLARLNAQGMGMGNLTDTDTGLDNSVAVKLSGMFQAQTSADPIEKKCGGDYPQLCMWLQGDMTSIQALQKLLNGQPVLSPAISVKVDPSDNSKPVQVMGSCTVAGFINNSMMVHLPGQPGMNPPKFALKFDFTPNVEQIAMPSIDFPCNYVAFVGCLPRLLTQVIYNSLIKSVFEAFLKIILNLIESFITRAISLPLQNMAGIFQQGLSIIQQPEVNPIIALANMGVLYINHAMHSWMQVTMASVIGAFVPWFGIVMFILSAFVMPIVGAWMSTMVLIGFITAYYVPFLPYMIFTFASLGWLMAVIEAMVAAPIVALGVTFPEGHEAFGKSEAAFMILLNIFLRPAMMIIGYIAAIILSYVSVWVINAGFANAILFMQGDPNRPQESGWNPVNAVASVGQMAFVDGFSDVGSDMSDSLMNKATGTSEGGGLSSPFPVMQSKTPAADKIDFQNGYPGWAGTFGFFMAVLLYVMMYLTVVQEAFNLITTLPDKVLRWIGGQAETIGSETGKWTDQVKGRMEKGGESTMTGGMRIGENASKEIKDKLASVKESPTVSATPTPGPKK